MHRPSSAKPILSGVPLTKPAKSINTVVFGFFVSKSQNQPFASILADSPQFWGKAIQADLCRSWETVNRVGLVSVAGVLLENSVRTKPFSENLVAAYGIMNHPHQATNRPPRLMQMSLQLPGIEWHPPDQAQCNTANNRCGIALL